MRPGKTLLAVLICILAVSLIPASPARSIDQSEKFARIRADMFQKELSLNNEQRAAIEKVCHEAFLQMKETAAGMDPINESEAMVQQLAMQLQRRNADLQKVLTADQLALYQEHKTDRYAELVTEILMMQLDLSETQISPVYDANMKAFGTIAGLMPVLEDGSKMKKRRAKKSVDTALQSRDDALKEILSSEQWKAYENFKEATDDLYGG
jgi:hypothetical protein